MKPTMRMTRSVRVTSMAAQKGSKVSSFSLPSTKGGTTKVPAKNGSVVFFFNKSDTPGCKAEANTFDELYSEFSKKGKYFSLIRSHAELVLSLSFFRSLVRSLF